MADDPANTTLSIITNMAKEAVDFAINMLKTLLSTSADLVKFGVFMNYRKKMMQGQQPLESKLPHGKQSLKDLRLHEAIPGTELVTVDLGLDARAKNVLSRELKREHIDFAITKSPTGHFELHYKRANEPDVLRAQQHMLEKRYGEMPEITPKQTRDMRMHDAGPENDHKHDSGHSPQDLRKQVRNPETLDAAISKAKETAQDKNAVLKLDQTRSPKARIKEIDLERVR